MGDDGDDYVDGTNDDDSDEDGGADNYYTNYDDNGGVGSGDDDDMNDDVWVVVGIQSINQIFYSKKKNISGCTRIL